MEEALGHSTSFATSTLVATGIVCGFIGLSLSAYAVRTLLVGRRQDPRVARLGGTILLGVWFIEAVYWVIRAPGKMFARLGVHPDTLTWTSLVVTAASLPIAASGHFSTAGLVFLVGAIFDIMDGMVARETKTVTRSGGVLDSVLDRWSDAMPFIGLAIFYRFSVWQMLIPLAALVGSQLVSYVRAKSESMGLNLPTTLMRRHERIAYVVGALVVAPMLSPILPSPWGAVHPATLTIVAIVAIVSNIVAFRLLLAARRELDANDAKVEGS
jgi:CDP-diacylglycerol--glycerol-3-phosphate 3-phosphatidyltransferase